MSLKIEKNDRASSMWCTWYRWKALGEKGDKDLVLLIFKVVSKLKNKKVLLLFLWRHAWYCRKALSEEECTSLVSWCSEPRCDGCRILKLFLN